MKYLFILGRNPELSIAELKAVFPRVDFERRDNAVLAEFQETLDAGFIDKLGGVISIGIVLGENGDLESKELYYDHLLEELPMK